MHIELTEMLRCPAAHRDEFLVLSTGEMTGRHVRTGLVGCPVCRRNYPIAGGVADFRDAPAAPARPAAPAPSGAAGEPASDVAALQALLDLGGPGGFVVLVGEAARHAAGLAALMGGVHFVGVNAPADVADFDALSLLRTDAVLPLRAGMARAVLVGRDVAESAAWVAEAVRVLLHGRRLVVARELAAPPAGTRPLAAGQGLWVGEKG